MNSDYKKKSSSATIFEFHVVQENIIDYKYEYLNCVINIQFVF